MVISKWGVTGEDSGSGGVCVLITHGCKLTEEARCERLMGDLF